MWRLHAQDESLGSQLLSTVLSIAAWSKCSLGSAPARLLQLLRVRLAALGSSACPGLGLATASQLLEPAASKVAHAFDHSGNDVQQAEAIFGSVAAAQSMRLANAIDWRGKSVLMHAASRDHAGMVELLVRHKSPNPHLSPFTLTLTLAELLVRHKARVEATDYTGGMTALMLAARVRHTGLEPQTSRPQSAQTGPLLTRVSLTLDRTARSPRWRRS